MKNFFMAAFFSAAAGAAAAQNAAIPRVDGVLQLGPAALTRTGAFLRVDVDFPPQPPVLATRGEARSMAPLRRQLARLVARGAAAGNHGDLYDNRDRGHIILNRTARPTMTAVAYDESLRAQGLDYGFNHRLIFGAPTIGNASLASTAGPLWRSLPRLALSKPGLAASLTRLRRANHLYVYPEHRDHDPGLGDLFPVNTAYHLISQGSSGSVSPVLAALADGLAALRPDTKALLIREGLIAPTLQMLVRRSLPDGRSAQDYLTGAAHPTAIDGAAIDRARLVALAQSIEAASAPASARIAVVAEQRDGPPPPDPFAADIALLDAPGAAARIAVAPGETRRYRLRASARDPNGRPARIVWRVLRGTGVTLTPDPDGTGATVIVPWQIPAPAPGPQGLTSTRVDVAAFADNGVWVGAPAFFSVAFPQDRRRRVDAGGRLRETDFAAAPPDAYRDPAFVRLRPWRDVYRRGPDGRVLEWTRHRADAAPAAYTRHGMVIEARDALGRPTRARASRFSLSSPGADGLRTVVERPGGPEGRYVYAGPDDVVGRLEAAP